MRELKTLFEIFLNSDNSPGIDMFPMFEALITISDKHYTIKTIPKNFDKILQALDKIPNKITIGDYTVEFLSFTIQYTLTQIKAKIINNKTNKIRTPIINIPHTILLSSNVNKIIKTLIDNYEKIVELQNPEHQMIIMYIVKQNNDLNVIIEYNRNTVVFYDGDQMKFYPIMEKVNDKIPTLIDVTIKNIEELTNTRVKHRMTYQNKIKDVNSIFGVIVREYSSLKTLIKFFSRFKNIDILSLVYYERNGTILIRLIRPKGICLCKNVEDAINYINASFKEISYKIISPNKTININLKMLSECYESDNNYVCTIGNHIIVARNTIIFNYNNYRVIIKHKYNLSKSEINDIAVLLSELLYSQYEIRKDKIVFSIGYLDLKDKVFRSNIFEKYAHLSLINYVGRNMKKIRRTQKLTYKNVLFTLSNEYRYESNFKESLELLSKIIADSKIIISNNSQNIL